MADSKNDSKKKIPHVGVGWFEKAAIGAPFLAGAGVGIRNVWKSINIPTMDELLGRPAANKSSSVRSFAKQVTLPGLNPTSYYIDKISKLQADQINNDIIKMGWEVARANRRDPMYFGPLNLDDKDPLSSIRTFVNRNNSMEAQGLMDDFLRQTSALKKHVAAGGSLSFAKMGSFNLPLRQSITDYSVLGNTQLAETLSSIDVELGKAGSAVDWKMAARPGVAGSQLMGTVSGGKLGSRTAIFEIPMEISGQPGIITHGATQQTKRIIGQWDEIANNKVVSTLKNEEYTARRFLEQIIPAMKKGGSSSEMIHLINDFNQENIKRSQWIHNMQPGQFGPHDIMTRIAASRRNLFHAGTFEALDSQEVGDFIRQNPDYYPAGSPEQTSKGILSKLNPQEWWGGVHFPEERRPFQAVMREFGPSSSAIAHRAVNPLRSDYSWLYSKTAKDVMFNETPMDLLARTVFVSPRDTEFHAKYLGGAFGGAGIASETLLPQMQFTEPLHLDLSAKYKQHDDVSRAMGHAAKAGQVQSGNFNFVQNLASTPNGILGYDAEGQPITFESDMRITGAMEYTDRNAKFLRLHGTREITDEKFQKYHGTEKAVLETGFPQEQIDKHMGNFARNVEIIVSMDSLRKNRSLHNLQMLTALHEVVTGKLRGEGRSEASERIFLDTVQQLHGETNYDKSMGNIFKIARAHQLNAAEMGQIFGALPDTMGESTWAQQANKLGLSFNMAEEQAIFGAKKALGIGQYYYGGKSNAGGMGSVEPRVFEMLQGPHYGALGTGIAEDLAERMYKYNPEMAREQGIIGEALGSITNGVVKREGLANYKLGNMSEATIAEILEKGGSVDLAGMVDNATSIIVPGQKSSLFMDPYQTHHGQQVFSPLHHAYENFLEHGNLAATGAGSQARTQEAFKHLTNVLGGAYASTITGKGYGLARGKLPGSRYLTAVPTVAATTGDLYTYGLHPSDVEDMYGELRNLHGADSSKMELLDEQLKRLRAGESVGAASLRHPITDPFSAGPAKFIMSNYAAPGTVLVPQKTVMAQFEGKNIQLGMGFMAGQRGDFDADMINIMALSSPIEKDAAQHFSIKNSMREYEKYIIRQQIFVAKAVDEDLGMAPAERAAAAAQKMAMSKEKVGQLSVPISNIRAAVLNAGNAEILSAERTANAMTLLGALENVPIAGKHVKLSEVSKLAEQLNDLTIHAQRATPKDIGDLTSLAQDILSKTPAAAYLTKDKKMMLNIEGKDWAIDGIDMNDAGAAINEAMTHHRTQGLSTMDEQTSRMLLRGRGKVTSRNAQALLNASGGFLSMFKSGSKEAAGTLASKASRIKMSIINSLAAAGKNVVSHAGKPLALGFGASLAISAMLSRPISNLDSDASSPPMGGGKIRSGNSTGVLPENLHPDSQISGEPTGPGMGRPSARVSMNDDQVARVFIRGKGHGINAGSLSSGIQQQLGRNSTVNVNIRDQRRSLTQQNIDAIIRR